MSGTNILWFEEISLNNIDKVGGKNASLGEMIRNITKLGVKVPNGFATTASAYKEFLTSNNLQDKIYQELAKINVDNIPELAAAGKKIRDMVLGANFSAEFEQEIRDTFAKLEQKSGGELSVAVRSSATAEDLPNASFAGQQDTILNVKGIENVLQAIKQVFASLFTDRAIAYREHHGFPHAEVLLSVGIQKMVRSDKAAAGVMFTLDTESGFDEVVFITSAYGLGELVVQGTVNPDEFYLDKRALRNDKLAVISKNVGTKQQRMVYNDASSTPPVKIEEVTEELRASFSLTDAELVKLANYAMIIESHYKRPMDIEWAKDGIDGELYIVQARPETVKSRESAFNLEKYNIKPNQKNKVLTEGRSVGQKIGQGKVNLILDLKDINNMRAGDVLVTDMTDPDWEPAMKRAAAIVTNRGGRTCHAAIIARELGIPAVVGTGSATQDLSHGESVTVSCAEGDIGKVYSGALEFEVQSTDCKDMPKVPVKIMMNIGNPTQAFMNQSIPNSGVGLARVEFIISQMIGVHPRACLEFAKLSPDLQKQIMTRAVGYENAVDFYTSKLAEGIAMLGVAFWPNPVIVRFSDFKSNEYANLIGGNLYEPNEENPMLGYRGASRYVDESFKACFELECKALKKVREQHGLTNIQAMVPFVRTVNEAKRVINQIEAFGLKRGEHDLKIMMMCEIPSNAILAEEFLQYFDGFSIGSNDLTQMTLGVDRDSGIVAHLFNEKDQAVKLLLEKAIRVCRENKKYVGICGQAPSDHPDFAKWLMEQGIESVSLTPDSILSTWQYLAKFAVSEPVAN